MIKVASLHLAPNEQTNLFMLVEDIRVVVVVCNMPGRNQPEHVARCRSTGYCSTILFSHIPQILQLTIHQVTMAVA